MNQRLKATALSILFLVAFIAVWAIGTKRTVVTADKSTLDSSQVAQLSTGSLTETDVNTLVSDGLTFEQIKQISEIGISLSDINDAGGVKAFGFTTGGVAEEAVETTGFPGPALVWKESWDQLKNPFYDKGPNDKGIGVQLKYSLMRVAIGFTLAILVAVPLGFIIGMYPIVNMALMPYIQILKPISPLAWLPVALYLIKDSEQASIFVIFICSVWPMLINTTFGVTSVKKDYLNIGNTLELSKMEQAFKIILPATAPTIFTGMRISIGIAWLVIVAAEMVIGGIGMGYFVWNEWNGLNLATMLFAIVVIGVVGLILDLLIGLLVKKFSYQEL